MATQAGPSSSSRNAAQKQPQRGRIQSDPLEQRCHDLENERTRLMDQLHRQELETEVEELRRHVVRHRASTSEIPESIIGESIATKRIPVEPVDSNLSDTDTTVLSQIQPRGFKVEKPEKYNSQSKRQYREYLRRCEIAYAVNTKAYPDVKTQIFYASQFLTGATLDTWLRYERQQVGQPSWNEYKKVLRDLLQEPVTRQATLALKYDQAYQKPGQGVRDFVNYLDELELEAEFGYTDKQRLQHLQAKLTPSLRMTLNNYQQTPTTRQGLINLAIQLEANQQHRGKVPEQHAKPKQYEDRKKRSSMANDHLSNLKMGSQSHPNHGGRKAFIGLPYRQRRGSDAESLISALTVASQIT